MDVRCTEEVVPGLVVENVTSEPDASKFLLLIPQSQLLRWGVADVSKTTLSKANDAGAVAVGLEVRCLP